MLPNSNLISSNFTTSIPFLPLKNTQNPLINSPTLPKKSFFLLHINQTSLLSPFTNMGTSHIWVNSSFLDYPFAQNGKESFSYPFRKMGSFQIGVNCSFSDYPLAHHGVKSVNSTFRKMGRFPIGVQCSFLEDPPTQNDEKSVNLDGDDGGGGGGGDWVTSFLLFVFWGGLLYYVFGLSPNQTPLRDVYFLKKLCNLAGDDGYRMNQVLVSLWYIMGLWPLLYSMLLLPSGRSSKGKVPVWPFLTLSFFGGAYALIPYFILWRPPPPPVEEEEPSRWPLNFLESKITAGLLGAAGLGLIVYAASATGDWNEFYQYFRESKLIHATSIDFSLLSAFAPFWVYNDMTVRKCYDKTVWLLPLSVLPFVGPALYLLLRPPVKTMPVSLESTLKSD